MFKAKCLRIGGYLANIETLEEAMLIKYKLMKMKTGNLNKHTHTRARIYIYRQTDRKKRELFLYC